MREVLHSRCREQIAAFLGNCPCCQARFSFTVCCTALTLRTIKTESPAAGFFENIGVTRSLSRLELRGGAIGRNEPSRLSLYIDAVNFNLAPAGGKRRRILLPIVFGNSLCRNVAVFRTLPQTQSLRILGGEANLPGVTTNGRPASYVGSIWQAHFADVEVCS